MKILSSRNICLLVIAVALAFAAKTTAAQQNLPNPSLLFLGQEYYEAGGKKLTRYIFEVVNKDKYPAELFVAAPELPPGTAGCSGARRSASWSGSTARPAP